MRTPLEQQVLVAIRHNRAILPGNRIGVAVSGGADSVALLRIFANLADELGITLLVAHLNHSLRGAESYRDARFVENLAVERGLRFVERIEDVRGLADSEGWNLEDAGRRLRRRFFENLVRNGEVDLVAVAHTADDQAETLLAQLMRGTGTTGLGGIYPTAPPIVRPLLESRRKDLREYLNSLQQDWCEDSTNSDTSRMRARIRKDLLPLIERDFSPAIVGHLNELARIAREEEAFWNAFVNEKFLKLTHDGADGLHIARLDVLAPLKMEADSNPSRSGVSSEIAAPMRALTERLIRLMYESVRGDRRELTVKHVEQVIHLASLSKSGRVVELPYGIIVKRTFDDLVFSRAVPRQDGLSSDETVERGRTYQYVVQLPLSQTTTLAVAEVGKRLSLNLIDWSSAQSDTIRDDQALDADLLRSPLILRNWRPGDSYRPRGRRDGRKLKAMMLAERIPASKRSTWPVLESNGRVVWALGMVPADEFCATDSTRQGLSIREERD